MDFEDSTLIKMFISMWWSDSKQRHLMVAIGGRGWWRRKCEGLGGCLERKRVNNHVFHAEEYIYNLEILLSKFISLSGNPLLALSTTPLRLRFALSSTFRTERNSSRVGIYVECNILH